MKKSLQYRITLDLLYHIHCRIVFYILYGGATTKSEEKAIMNEGNIYQNKPKVVSCIELRVVLQVYEISK